MMDERLLAILACPVCRAPLRLEGERLVCMKTQVSYPMEDGLPILLAERAEPVHPDDRSPAHATPA
jgi:uncharacterized protein